MLKRLATPLLILLVIAVGAAAVFVFQGRDIGDGTLETAEILSREPQQTMKSDAYSRFLDLLKKVRGARAKRQKQLTPQLGQLCFGSNECDAYCHKNSWECEDYCLKNPGNPTCQKRFSFVYRPGYKPRKKPFTQEGQQPAQTSPPPQSVQPGRGAEPEIAKLAPAPATPLPALKTPPPTPAPLEARPLTGRAIAAPQPWVFDTVTQPVPPGASRIRLTTLPAPYDKILLRHLGAFGAHIGGHPEGLDHEWIDIQEGTPVGSWADGRVVEVRLNNPSDPRGEWRIVIDYGDGLFGEHMDVKTPLVKTGDVVKAGQPIATGVPVPWIKWYHSGEFNLTDEHRRDGVKSWVRQFGVLVSPYDYLREDVKQEFIAVFTREVLEPYVAKGDTAGGVKPWEPYLTNPMLFHNMYKGTLVGEWFLKSKKWVPDETPDSLILLMNNTKYYDKKRILANEDENASPVFSGTWEADYEKKQFIFRTEEKGIYYGIFALDESGPRATLKIEYQRDSYPVAFSTNAHIYIERDAVGRRQDGYNLGVRESHF